MVITMGMNETLKAVSDSVRRDILQMLKGGKKSAGEIAEHFDLTGATVSYHLAKLKSADLITEQKHKNFIYYELNASVFEEVLTWIYSLGGTPLHYLNDNRVHSQGYNKSYLLLPQEYIQFQPE